MTEESASKTKALRITRASCYQEALSRDGGCFLRPIFAEMKLFAIKIVERFGLFRR
jgi:hypothetical protein